MPLSMKHTMQGIKRKTLAVVAHMNQPSGKSTAYDGAGGKCRHLPALTIFLKPYFPFAIPER